MPITEALKKLIKTITGKNAVGETIEELVQNLNDNYPEGSGGGGGGLPAAGAAGNVLTSTGDGWESAAPQSGRIEVFDGAVNNGTFTSNAQIINILAAHTAKKPVVMSTSGIIEGTTIDIPLISALASDDVDAVLFSTAFASEGTQNISIWGFYSKADGTQWEYIADVVSLPTVSAADNGKILGVENGSYGLVEPIYEVVLTPTGSGEYTATHNGTAVTVAEVMQAAANRNVVITTVDSGVTVIMPVSSVDATGNNLTFGAVVCAVSGQSLVEKRYYGIGFNDGTNDVWGMDTST